MEMGQEELRKLADLVITELYFTQNGGKDGLRDYVAGLTDEAPGNLAEIMCSYYYVSRRNPLSFEEEYQTNETVREMVTRLLRLLSGDRRSRDMLCRLFRSNQKRFYYYKEADLSLDIFLHDLDLNMDWISHSAFFNGLELLQGMAAGMVQYCPEAAGQLVAQYPGLKGKLRDAAAAIAAVRKDQDVVERELKELERRAFPNNDEEGETELLYQFLSLCSNVSKKVDEMAEKLLGKCPTEMYSKISGSGAEWFLNLCSSLNVSHAPKLDFLLNRIAEDGENERKKDVKGLLSVAKPDGSVLIRHFDTLCQREDDKALAAFAMMRKFGFLPPDSPRYEECRAKAREQLYKGLRREQEKYAAEGDKLFVFSGGEEDFSSLEAENPQEVAFDLDSTATSWSGWRYGRPSWDYLLHVSGMLVEELTAARNLIVLAASRMEGYYLTNLKLYDYSRDFFVSEGNPWEKLYRQKLPFNLLCRLGIMLQSQGYWYSDLTKLKGDLIEFLQAHKEEAEQEVRETTMDGTLYLQYVKLLYGEEGKEPDNGCGFDYNCLIGAFVSKSHYVVEFAEHKLQNKEAQVRPAVEEASKAKQRGAANAALRLLRLWDNEKIEKVMRELTDIQSFCEYIDKQYTKNNEKNVPFPKLIDYGCVRLADSEERMPEMVMKYFISEYVLLKELYIVKPCEEIRKRVNPYDLQNLMKQIFETWLTEGAGQKFRNILFPYALCAGSAQLVVLKKQIDEWSQNSKPGLAEFAVSCLAFQGTQMAFMMVDTMSKKHKNKRVKKAAAKALSEVMGVYGFSKEEFEDLIVPDMGFSRDRIRMFSYGVREFKAVLGPDLSVTLYDGDKVIKSLPKASDKYQDIAEAAEAAKEELKTVKKQMKAVVDAQVIRMGSAVYTKRKWTREKWEALFIGNPLMFTFACGMIWQETDKEGNALGTFRYMEDGTFNTADEEEYELHENSYLHLVHPADMEESNLEAWKTQLEDYEITQPAPQLDLPVADLEEGMLKGTNFPGFEGKQFYSGTVRSVAGKLGCEISFAEYGESCGFYRQFESDGLLFSVTVTSFYPGDYNALTEIQSIEFKQGNSPVPLCQVPKRLLGFASQAGSMLTAKAL